jgi:apolipoprotein D and lipocalin family protein
MKRALLFLFAGLILAAAIWRALFWEVDAMKTVAQVDLSRFMGDWYVVGNIPTFVERGAVNAVETYRMREDGRIDIAFTFRKGAPDGKRKRYRSTGFVINDKTGAEWRVQFFWPVKFPYFILELDPDYHYTVVGVPSRKYVWIMSRTPRLDEAVYRDLLNRLEGHGYDINKIQKVPQIWPGDDA